MSLASNQAVQPMLPLLMHLTADEVGAFERGLESILIEQEDVRLGS